MTLPQRLRQLEEAAPRLYARWSPAAWRAACEGPALRLWESLSAAGDDGEGFDDFLLLLREAVGLQYLAATGAEELAAPSLAAQGLLAAALGDAVPRLLPALRPEERARALAAVWNVGERLRAQPAWIDRFLAVRLAELTDLGDLAPFLEKALAEGLDPGEPSRWKGPFAARSLDPSRAIRSFLPGPMHLAAPAVVCVHDRRATTHVGVLLRPGRNGGSLLLGATPCLGVGDGAAGVPVPARAAPQVVAAAGLSEEQARIATRGGFALLSSPLSQRLWAVEAAA